MCKQTVIQLTVNNHPGVMSHICGLFARRAYNVEGIACMPVNGGTTSRIWLLVDADERLNQMIKQVDKLEDVLMVERHDGGHAVFSKMAEFVA
ncbi:MAG: acetolactate synthase small subunit [Pseudodesulfovibrio sp.]|uniref:acetolactate synthase n=1 Tax=Pseudodesulfovibrio aespoeensis (strain ATCC 700646 / DSM 10631 / Aspo-2) TaxID=643562 RepID=E6VY00_PSEA9|nr:MULTISPECIES: acetolactate synthase small subunit [Pseudodesulfovibrio]MBU4191006.1 acetolactate synthase small subunit [Pseudomonadota bacterium]ADU62707.1 amino acid-binding ACT domain protein [Pseudodesulfovibrio aespoeensis Aspo-2]MBU4242992.1 acetolactate synthase small subunit [Pseudomonadota bacterium]MBU4377809.1 acetolactate synthase small subunit [Pseudomonadota bacterium]MBU4476301.1 acetolactate synthase small subunit [Pseudomonadota bacterium]